MSGDFEQTPEFQLGRRGEDRVAEALKAAGFWVDMTAKHATVNGRGPRMYGAEGGAAVLPDIRALWHRLPIWVEVKTKTHAELGRITGKLEHCVDLKSWNDMLECQDRTGEPVFLVIVEVDTGAVLARQIDKLKYRRDCPTVIKGRRVMLFTREQFKEDGINHILRFVQRRREDATAAQGEL